MLGSHTYQFLDRVSKDVRRFYICRNVWCTWDKATKANRGSFYGLNSFWVNTLKHGGGRYACPVCGQPYRPGASSSNHLPGHHLWVMEAEAKIILAEWPNSAEEDALGKMMQVMHADDLAPFEKMDSAELQEAVISMINKCAMPANFEALTVTPAIIKYFEEENKKLARQQWSWDHLLDGFNGAFYLHKETDPVMLKDDVKIFLASLNVLVKRMTPGA